jgi:hypothetical protein
MRCVKVTFHYITEASLKENSDLLKNLEKVYQKMEVLAACIDKLHERYLLQDKLNDDYISNEFSWDIKEPQTLRTRK